MARSLGLPARVAVGFTPGTRDAGGRWHVTGKEAHAWPEVYLNGYGWVAFEPTPGRGLPGAEDYTEVRPAQAADAPATTVVQPATPLEPVEPLPEPSDTVTTLPEEREAPGARLAVGAILLALAALYVVGVPFAKRRRRLRRREAAVTAADRVLVAWTEATEDMTAAGLAPRPEETAVEYAHRVRKAAGPAGPALIRLADDTTTAAWCAGGVPADVAARAEAEAADVAGSLAAQATTRERVQKALDPRLLFKRERPPAVPAKREREPVEV